jgi:hypothetical protein
VNFKLKTSHIVGKLVITSIVLIIIFYLTNTLSLIANRSLAPINSTSWISIDNEIRFHEKDTGIIELNDTEYLFNFTQNNGYIFATIDEELTFEFTLLNDEQLYCVNLNEMFYNEAYL